MAGLITVEELEQALGSDIPSGTETTRAQWYIDVVSEYIETYTGQDFTPQTGVVLICETDRRGAIEFASLNSVTTVEYYDPWTAVYTVVTSGSYAFDGVNTIYGLIPYSTYRLTVSYGYTSAPLDIKGIVSDLVLSGAGLGSGSTGGLVTRRVGDVEESYGVPLSGSGEPIIIISSLQRSVLDAYRRTTRTWRL